MTTDDEFGHPNSDPNVTRLRPQIPTPGGRPTTPDPFATQVEAPQPQRASPQYQPYQQPQPSWSGQSTPVDRGYSDRPISYFNQSPLISAATPLLILSSQLRNLTQLEDVTTLRNQVLGEISTFENRAAAAGVPQDVVFAARYVICAHLDEIVLNTVWGHRSSWTQQSLLSTLHADSLGGERFFKVAEGLPRDQNSDPQLIELMLLCINLGFKGIYRRDQQGAFKIDEVRNALYEALRKGRNRAGSNLSPHWTPISRMSGGLRDFIPLWVLYSVAAAFLLVVFLGFNVALQGTNQELNHKLQSVGQVSDAS